MSKGFLWSDVETCVRTEKSRGKAFTIFVNDKENRKQIFIVEEGSSCPFMEKMGSPALFEYMQKNFFREREGEER